MFFFRRKKKNRSIPPPVSPPIPKEFIYYLREYPDADGILLALSHSSSRPENADIDDFTAISRKILEEIFSGFWVSAWVWDGKPCDYVLPDGQRCEEKRIFSQAFQQYAKHSGLSNPVLVNEGGRIVLFSQGFFSPFSHHICLIFPKTFFVVKCISTAIRSRLNQVTATMKRSTE